jgi:uncharacterized protein YggU (UPF0235/DUF167 family)
VKASSTNTVRITVRARPRAKNSRVLRVEGPTVEVARAAPPVDGAANDELLIVLADVLSVPRRALALVMGSSSRTKVVEVNGLDESEVVARLRAAVR